MNLENRRRRVYNGVKTELREIALDVFAKRGFDLVTIRDVAFAAGISERTFARYFREKEDVLLNGLCESSHGFREALMALPRSTPPIDAFRHTISTLLQSQICFESILAVVLYSEKSTKLRAAFNERSNGWQADIAKAIADWLECPAESDFRPAFWASTIFAALLFAVRLEIGETGVNAEFRDPGKVIDVAFDHLQSLTAPAAKLPNSPNNPASAAPMHLVYNR